MDTVYVDRRTSPASTCGNGGFKPSLEGSDDLDFAKKAYEKGGCREEEDAEDEGEGEEEDDEEDDPGDFKNSLNKEFVHDDKPQKPEEDDYLYLADLEARAAVKFNKYTFCKEFLYHTFFPLTAPLMYYLDGGWLAFTNRTFVGRENFYLVFSQWFWAANFYLLNVVTLLYVAGAKDFSYLFDVALVDILWCMRNLVVATKYAFLSKIELEEMQTKVVPSYVHEYRTLLAAWKDPIPRRVLKYELLLAAVRHKLMLKKYSFSLDTSINSSEALRDLVLDLRLVKEDFTSLSFSYGKRADRWLEIGTEDLIKEPIAWAEGGGVANVGHLPARLYAAHVIRQASSLSRLKRIGHTLLSQHLRKCALILGVAHAIIPMVGRYTIGGHMIPGPKWALYCNLIPSCILISFAMISNLGFMMIGVLDFRRRHFIAQSLDDVLRTGVYKGTHHVRTRSLKKNSSWVWGIFPAWLFRGERNDNEYSTRSGASGELSGEGIFFDFTKADSILAWWSCRQLMSNFGYGFYKRIKCYTTYFAGYCVALLAFIVVKMLTGLHKKDFALLITTIFSIHVFLTLLALMVWPGGDANNLLQLHGTTLIRRKIRNQMHLMKEMKLLDPEEMRTRRAVIDTISSIAEGVKWDNAKTKLSICGFEASDQLVSVIVAVVTASMSIGIGQIVQNGITI